MSFFFFIPVTLLFDKVFTCKPYVSQLTRVPFFFFFSVSEIVIAVT